MNQPDSATTAVPPELAGRWTGLRPLRPDDLAFFYEVMADARVGYRWRFRGHLLSFDEFSRAMWQGVSAQFVVHKLGSQAPLGLVAIYNADARHGIAYFAYMVRPDLEGAGYPMEGIGLMLDYAFKIWNLRKIYAEALSFNFVQFESWQGRVFETEGILKDHEYYDGRYWDLYVMSCTRESWADYRRRRPAQLPASTPNV